MRTFIAIPIAPTTEITNLLSQLEGLRGPLKTTSPSQLHMTLKFLGATKPQDMAVISQAMSDGFHKVQINSLHLRETGVFPRIERPNVVWVGVDQTADLMRLAVNLEIACDALGYPQEDRAYHPHITLARVKSRPPATLASMLADFASTDFGTVAVDKVCLYRSELSRSGPAYTVLATAPAR